MTELLTREFTVRVAADEDTDARTVTGIAVPYGQIIERYDAEYDTHYERFEAGSVKPHPDGHMYFYGHGEPIGKVTAERDTDAGYEITATISATTRGNDVYTLAKDGVLTKHSIGFYPVEARVDMVALGDDGVEVAVLTRTGVLARETSILPFPAYDKADVLNVRDRDTQPPNKENRMPEPTGDVLTRADLNEVNTHLQTIDRQLAVIGDGGQGRGDDSPILDYRSHGEFLKALANGEAREQVPMLNRAFADVANVVADVKDGVRPTWVDRDVKLVENKRPIINLFNRDPLPAEGMSITFPLFDSKSGDVARQENEGDDLGLFKLKIKNGKADVYTEGGAAELSKKVIDRYPAAYLNKVLQMIKISYAKRTNSITRNALLGASGVGTTVDLTLGGTVTPKAADYVAAMIDAAAAIEDDSLGLALDFVLAPRAAFKRAAILTDQVDRLQFGINGGGQTVNAIGSLNVKAQTLDVGGVPWILDPGMAANTNPRACSAEALTVLESPGAPFQLTDENVINLTEAFSLYGYIATTVDDPKGIVPLKTA